MLRSPRTTSTTIPFLAAGGYSSFTGVVAGQLNPWPGIPTPPPVCIAPVANAGGPYTVGSGGTVTLAATSTGTSPVYSWTAPAQVDGTLAPLNSPNPIYTAPSNPGPGVKVELLPLTVSNACGTSNVTATVNISAATAPTVDPVPAQSVTSGATSTIALTGSDANVPPSLPLTFTVTQAGSPALTGVSVTQSTPTAAVFHYTAPTGVTNPPKVITLSIKATNAAGQPSPVVTTTVTISPVPVGQAPVANAGGPYVVNSGASITLAGSATGTSPFTFAWTALPAASGSITPLNNAAPVYKAPVVAVPTTVTLTLKVTNSAGSSTVTTTVLVNPAARAERQPGGRSLGVLRGQWCLHRHRFRSQHPGAGPADLQVRHPDRSADRGIGDEPVGDERNGEVHCPDRSGRGPTS